MNERKAEPSFIAAMYLALGHFVIDLYDDLGDVVHFFHFS